MGTRVECPLLGVPGGAGLDVECLSAENASCRAALERGAMFSLGKRLGRMWSGEASELPCQDSAKKGWAGRGW